MSNEQFRNQNFLHSLGKAMLQLKATDAALQDAGARAPDITTALQTEALRLQVIGIWEQVRKIHEVN